MAIPLVLISATGLFYLISIINRLKYRIPIYYLLTAIFILSFVFFVDAYFVHLPVHNAKYWHYGFKEAILTIAPIQDNYDQIIFQQGYSQPYIYFLFYTKYDPSKYQINAKIYITNSDVGLVKKLDNIEFQFFSWEPQILFDRTLIVGNNIVIPDIYDENKFSLIKEIMYPDNLNVALRIMETI